MIQCVPLPVLLVMLLACLLKRECVETAEDSADDFSSKDRWCRVIC